MFGFFDEAWPQPFENSQRMWSYDRTVRIDKPLAAPWRSIGFHALAGQSVIAYKEGSVEETIVEALEEIREQHRRGRILLVTGNHGLEHCEPDKEMRQRQLLGVSVADRRNTTSDRVMDLDFPL